MEKQFLINQFKLDRHVLYIIKDYVFETVIVRDKNYRYKERNLSYLRERINIKTYAFEMGELNEIIEMPNMFYRNIDNKYDDITSYLNECWLAIEEEIVLLWKKYAIQREKTYETENKEINDLNDRTATPVPLEFGLNHLRDNEINVVLTKASIYDDICWKQLRSDIINYGEYFDINLVPFKDIYFMCMEGRDIYMQTFLEDGSLTLYRKGVLDEDNDTILNDRHSWWKEIHLSSGELCSVNPSTNAIYKSWSYQKSNIIGALYNNEIVLF